MLLYNDPKLIIASLNVIMVKINSYVILKTTVSASLFDLHGLFIRSRFTVRQEHSPLDLVEHLSLEKCRIKKFKNAYDTKFCLIFSCLHCKDRLKSQYIDRTPGHTPN